MFLKYKTRRAMKKIINGAPKKEIKNAVKSVLQEASHQLSRKMDKFNYRLPVKVTINR